MAMAMASSPKFIEYLTINSIDNPKNWMLEKALGIDGMCGGKRPPDIKNMDWLTMTRVNEHGVIYVQ